LFDEYITGVLPVLFAFEFDCFCFQAQIITGIVFLFILLFI